MEKREYIPWDTSKAGVSFSLEAGRIRMFRTTMEQLGNPAYFRFLYNPEQKTIAVQKCSIDTKGAHEVPEIKDGDSYEINSMPLVRMLYSHCAWKKKISYRVLGEYFDKQKMIVFDLSCALEIHEGLLRIPE